MSSRPSPARNHRPVRYRVVVARAVAIALVVAGVVAGVVGIVDSQASTAGAVSTTSGSHAPSPIGAAVQDGSRPEAPLGNGDTTDAVAAEDGGIPDGTTVFDSDRPAIGKLAHDLVDALRRAATDAQGEQITFFVNSGWRSARYQELLLTNAIAKYGSTDEAARWVATPATSPHVKGAAVDMAQDAAAWLSANGSAYGLCQIYANESWHFELRPNAIHRGCPAMYPDPTYDPRMN